MKRSVPSVLSIAALLVTACGDAPTQPEKSITAISPSAARFSVATASGTVVDLTGDFRRITADVLPGFNDQNAAKQLSIHLSDISSAIAAGDKAEASRVLGLARTTVTSETVNEGDRGYIEMVFRELDAALQQ